MKNTNVCIVRGNLTHDCEVSSTTGNKPTTVVKFRIANNGFNEHTNYFNCVWFGKAADAISPYLMKGVKVIVVGELTYSEWDTKDGKRNKVEITVSSVEMLSWPDRKPETNDEEMPF